MDNLKKLIRDIPDFPRPGIMFRDITPLLADADGLKLSVNLIGRQFQNKNIDKVVGIESRGFIFGTAIAYYLKVGFVPIRKPKKLPWQTIQQKYDLEYGQDAVEIHADALSPGQRVLVVDDLLATGGTLFASCQLIERLKAKVIGIAVLIELAPLKGREKLKDYDIFSLMKY